MHDVLLVQDADEAGQLDGDLALHAARLDLGDDGGGLVERGGAARRGLQVVAADDLAEGELEEGVRGSTRSRTASSPLASRRSHGSMLSGAIAM